MNLSSGRRTLVAMAATAPLLSACGSSAVAGMPLTADALRAIDGLDGTWRSTGEWSLPQVLVHLAQSIEYSMDGFPQAKSALFQSTLGLAAWSVFDARGRMTHGLGDPIPGAPPLQPAPTLDQGRQRLREAFNRFEAHTGPLQPHFAYGALAKSAYTRAHLMHVANHWTEFVQS